MADTLSSAAPQTPTRKLFKPSSKIQTPKLKSSPSTGAPSSEETTSGSIASIERQKLFRSSPSASQTFKRTVSGTGKLPVDDIAKSTGLAPLTAAENITSGKLPDELSSNGTSDTPIGLIDHDIYTPSRSTTDPPRSTSRDTTGTMTGLQGSQQETDAQLPVPSETANAEETVSKSADTAVAPASVGDQANPAADLTKYFADEGNPEMSNFVAALTGKAPEVSKTAGAAAETAESTAQKASDSAKSLVDGDSKPGEQAEKLPATKEVEKVASSTAPNQATVEPDENSSSAEQSAPGITRSIDNMGKPARIQKSVEIPLPLPQKVVNSTPSPSGAVADGITAELSGMPSMSELSKTGDLPSTDNLPQFDDSPDPPEEILDPAVHSPVIISPIPKIARIAALGLEAPPDLRRLAHGLQGFKVDDVGSIIDGDGKVVGHATGDLPSMVGKAVAESGEVLDDNGEVIGHVTENLLGPPPPAEIPRGIMDGLKVDHEGNILDPLGNVIGKFHHKPGESGSLAPFVARPQADSASADNQQKPKEEPKEDPKPANRLHDLFLDIKSTNDGIQLIIKIPTMFSKQPNPEDQPQEQAQS